MSFSLNSLPDTTEIYECNQRSIKINFKQLPILSVWAKEFLERQIASPYPSFEQKLTTKTGFQARYPLEGHVQSIEATKQALKKAKNDSKRDQCFVARQSIVLVIFLIGVIFFTIFFPEIGLGGVFLYLGINLYLAKNAQDKIWKAPLEGGVWSHRPCLDLALNRTPSKSSFMLFPLYIVFAGIGMPLYEVCTRSIRLENILNQKEIDLKKEISRYQDDIRTALPQAYQFCKEGKIQQALAHFVELEERALEVDRRFGSSLNRAQKRAIRNQKREWEEIKKELINYEKFLAQFDPVEQLPLSVKSDPVDGKKFNTDFGV